MTIRRVAVLISLVALGAFAAFGQVPAISPAVLTSTGCTAPSTTVSCAPLSTAYTPVTLSVTNPPAGTPTWSFGVGTPPPGLTIDPVAGTISGAASQAGEFTFTVTAHYSGQNVTQQYWVYVSSGSLTILASSLPGGTVGVPLSTTITATGGVPFVDQSNNIYYQWSIVSGSQPDGLVIGGTNGVLSGSPVAAGAFPITLNVVDHNGTSVNSQQYTFSVGGTAAPLTITTTSLGSGVLNVAYNQTLQVTGASSAVTWSVISGTLPPGLGISSNANFSGTISGTPTAANTYNFTVQAFTSTGTATQALSITITATATTLTMANPTNVSGAVGQTVTMQFTATGGITPYTYTVQSGTLPASLTLNASTGKITGTATTAGVSPLTILVTDSSSPAQTATATATITITAPLSMANPTAVSGNVGQTISPQWMQFTATGGTSPYTYAIVAGGLPGGLTLNAQTGAITGQAAQTCTCALIVQVTDSSSPVQTATATGSVTTTLLSITGAISLTTSAGVAITPGGAVTAGTQPTVTVTLATAPPETVNGTLTAQFTRLFDTQGSKEVLFSTGVPFVTFTVPAGSTQATFAAGSLAVLAGTAAGFGQITATFQDALGNNIPSPTLLPFTFSIAGTTPVIKAFTLTCSGTTYSASVIGYSTTLDMTNALFNFTATSGTNLAASSVTVPLSSLFSGWYSTSQSNQYGGQFMLTVPFTFTVSAGSTTNPIAAMTVTLTNSKGASTVSSPASPNPACQ